MDVADDLPAVAVDADQFQHALQNLLDNGLTHTPQGGRITLSARAADGRVVFAIPFQRDFTLIGTTDRSFAGDPASAVPT